MSVQQTTYKKYTAQFTVDLDSDVIHGRVLEINDVLSFEGKTVDEAKKEFHKAIDDYLDFCQRKGIEPEKPFSGKFLFRTKTPDDHRRIYLAASKTGKTINAWMQDVSSDAASRDLGDRSTSLEAIAKSSSAPVDPGYVTYDDPNFIESVYEELKPQLVSTGPVNTVQFVNAVHAIRYGLETIKPCLRTSKRSDLVSVVEAIEKEATRNPAPRSPNLKPN